MSNNYCYTGTKIRHKKLQHFAMKIAMGGLKKYDNISPIIKKIAAVKNQRNILYIHTCIMVFRAVNRKDWLVTHPNVEENNNVRIRQRNNPKVKRFRTDFG